VHLTAAVTGAARCTTQALGAARPRPALDSAPPPAPLPSAPCSAACCTAAARSGARRCTASSPLRWAAAAAGAAAGRPPRRRSPRWAGQLHRAMPRAFSPSPPLLRSPPLARQTNAGSQLSSCSRPARPAHAPSRWRHGSAAELTCARCWNAQPRQRPLLGSARRSCNGQLRLLRPAAAAACCCCCRRRPRRASSSGCARHVGEPGQVREVLRAAEGGVVVAAQRPRQSHRASQHSPPPHSRGTASPGAKCVTHPSPLASPRGLGLPSHPPRRVAARARGGRGGRAGGPLGHSFPPPARPPRGSEGGTQGTQAAAPRDPT
jgi:hypothetical protein